MSTKSWTVFTVVLGILLIGCKSSTNTVSAKKANRADAGEREPEKEDAGPEEEDPEVDDTAGRSAAGNAGRAAGAGGAGSGGGVGSAGKAAAGAGGGAGTSGTSGLNAGRAGSAGSAGGEASNSDLLKLPLHEVPLQRDEVGISNLLCQVTIRPGPAQGLLLSTIATDQTVYLFPAVVDAVKCGAPDWKLGNINVSGPILAAADGSLYGRRAYDSVVHYDPAGAESWVRDLPAGLSNFAIAEAPSPRIYAAGMGNSTQLPGMPASMRGYPYLIAFGADGTELWAKQGPDYGTLNARVSGPAADGEGHTYLVSEISRQTQVESEPGLIISEYDASGAVVWRTEFYYDPQTAGGTTFYDRPRIAVSDDGSAIYLVQNSSQFNQVMKLDTDGKLLWANRYNFRSKYVVQEVEGVERTTLQVSELVAFTAGNDVCLGGEVLNQYVNGSVRYIEHRSPFVACLDAAGKVEWSRQYRFGDRQPTYRNELNLSAARAFSNGDIIVTGNRLGNPNVASEHLSLTFRLGSDGLPK